MNRDASLNILSDEVSNCRKCPRLVSYRQQIAREKRRAFRHWDYWGRGVPGFGDPQAQLLILGLAPAAHGANRTGRVFTGDRSGDFLYKALHKVGFANQPSSQHRNDGLRLSNAYIAAAVRCAPPENKPLPIEILNCRPYLASELAILRPRAILALGRIAWDAYLDLLKQEGKIRSRSPYPFSHGAEVQIALDLPRLFGIFHPSQQNTQTGRVSEAMYANVLSRVRKFLAVD